MCQRWQASAAGEGGRSLVAARGAAAAAAAVGAAAVLAPRSRHAACCSRPHEQGAHESSSTSPQGSSGTGCWCPRPWSRKMARSATRSARVTREWGGACVPCAVCAALRCAVVRPIRDQTPPAVHPLASGARTGPAVMATGPAQPPTPCRAFRSGQANACFMPKDSCLRNSISELWTADEQLISSGEPRTPPPPHHHPPTTDPPPTHPPTQVSPTAPQEGRGCSCSRPAQRVFSEAHPHRRQAAVASWAGRPPPPPPRPPCRGGGGALPGGGPAGGGAG